jgi:Uncharacterized conserved protein
MATFFMVQIRILDKKHQAACDEYISKIKPIVEGFGGQYLIHSEAIKNMLGTWQPDRMIVIQFENRDKLKACFSSAEYRTVAGLREKHVFTDAIIVEG